MDNDKIVVVAHHLSIDFYGELAKCLSFNSEKEVRLLVLTELQKTEAFNIGVVKDRITTLESFKEKHNNDECILLKYKNINWNEIIASERSFTDYSFLFNSNGERRENYIYTYELLSLIAKFFDKYLKNASQVISSFGDNIFNHIANVMAYCNGTKLYIPQNNFLNEKGQLTGHYIGNTPYLESYSMISSYMKLKKRELTNAELIRINDYKKSLLNYKHEQTLTYIYKKNDFEKPITPNIWKLFSYLKKNYLRDKYIEFYKIDPFIKFKANILRAYRLKRISFYLKRNTIVDFPENFVFFPMHFQPEASTLVNGLRYSNQISLIESISMSLPVNYTLIVKEHPRGRGTRPLWQYKFINQLHNVQISDYDSKDILRKASAVIIISGSIGLEACAMDKPVICLGRTFHSYSDVYYKVKNIKDLPRILFRVLLNKEYENDSGRFEKINKFFLSYIDNIKPNFANMESGKTIAKNIFDDSVNNTDQYKKMIEEAF